MDATAVGCGAVRTRAALKHSGAIVWVLLRRQLRALLVVNTLGVLPNGNVSLEKNASVVVCM